jgi:KDO2-lipid IV(A) lauroyltransferase
VLRALGRGLGLLVWLCAPSLRRTALSNVTRALPEVAPSERSAFVRRVYRSLGVLLGEVAFTLDPRRPIEPLTFLPGSRECLDDAVAEGRGVVFASAHLGPWERVAASLVDAGVPLTVVAREPYDPRFARVYERLREARGVRTVYRGRPGAAIALVRVLRGGGVLGIPMDLASRVPSTMVRFLGLAAPTAIGPARLAIRTGAAVVVGTAAPRADGSLGIAVARIPPSACERELTERINDELGARIRGMPHMWPWMHPRWGQDTKRG